MVFLWEAQRAYTPNFLGVLPEQSRNSFLFAEERLRDYGLGRTYLLDTRTRELKFKLPRRFKEQKKDMKRMRVGWGGEGGTGRIFSSSPVFTVSLNNEPVSLFMVSSQ